MKTPICYTGIEDLSEELQILLINQSFNEEDLKKLQEGLEASNGDYDGQNESLIREIKKILKTEIDIINYHNNF